MATTRALPVRKTPLESHDVHVRRLLQHAEEQLAKGDRLQASEKAWGAVAHQLKVIAKHRNRKYTRHHQLGKFVRELAGETDDPVLVQDLFGVAEGLHENFYQDVMDLDSLRFKVGRVRELLDILGQPQFVGEGKKKLPAAIVTARDQPRSRGEMRPR